MSGGFSQPPSIPMPGFPGTPDFIEGTAATNPGNPVEVLTKTVAVDTVMHLHQLFVSSSISGKMEVKANGSLIGEGRTRPGSANIFFSWFPGRPIGAGVAVKVWFTARPGSAASSVSAFLQTTVTSD